MRVKMKEISNFTDYLISESCCIRDAIAKINTLGGAILFVTHGESLRLSGAVSDGDIRRGLLCGGALDTEIKAVMNSSPYALCADTYPEDILNVLVSLDLPSKQYIPIVDAEKNINGIYKSLPKTHPPALLYANGLPVIPLMITNLVEHCNLNCKGCLHYCPLVEEEVYVEVEQFNKDMHELARKLIIGRLRLMGGEPLLHPQIDVFIKVARTAFPFTDIYLHTNGLLLPEMPEAFWQACRENRVRISISKYPVITNDKASEWLELIENKNVKVGGIHLAKEFFSKKNPEGNSDIELEHSLCTQKICVTLRKSKIYPCNECFIEHYNSYFGSNYPVPPSIDIYINSGEEIVQQLFKPFSACGFCSYSMKGIFPWEQSKKEKNEWLI